MTARFTVRTGRFLVSWIHDAAHPEDPQDGAVVSWHLGVTDAECVCAALNRSSAEFPLLAAKAK